MTVNSTTDTKQHTNRIYSPAKLIRGSIWYKFDIKRQKTFFTDYFTPLVLFPAFWAKIR